MSISGISSGSSATPLTFQSLRTQINQDFSTISSSLQSDGVSAAQQAYADIVQLTQGGSTAAAGSTLGKDFSSLGSALQSGNASSAQAALSQFDTDAVAQAHHHRHGGGSAESSSASSDTSASGTPDSSTAASSTTGSSGGSNFLGSLVQLGLSLLK